MLKLCGFVGGVSVVACASAAGAADKPVFAPAPAWVTPVAPPAIDPKSDGAAIRMMLQDQQVSLEPGKQSRYSENILKIQTPQGLQAGSVNVAWNPDTDTLTIHKLHLLRGTQVIDVLASGQTFTVLRRENNLEKAMLDGVLTATIQPEGLQVGDVIDFAATLTHSDPTLKDHAEIVAGGWDGVPVGVAHLRASWPSAMPVRLRVAPGLPALKPRKEKDGRTVVELNLANLQPFVAPKGAPMRYGINRVVEMSDFASWQAISELMAPLYVKASTLPATGPLQTEIQAIRAKTSDPKARAEAALALVQDRVRYVFLGMNEGGLVPADAETTWSRRFGDCKGKTALLLAVLHALDIAAQPVLVSSRLGDGMDQRLPTVGAFDHVFVKALVAGKTYWLDGTRTGDGPLDGIEIPAFHWALPVGPGGGQLVALMPPPLDQPNAITTVRIDATAGITAPAPFHVEMVTKGDEAVGTNLALSNLTPDALDRALRQFWKGQYDFVEVKSTTVSFDPATRTEKMVMDGIATMDWDGGRYETDGLRVGYKADFSRDAGADLTAPFAVTYPFYSRTVEEITLPPGWVSTTDAADEVDKTVAGIAYRRHASYEKNVFRVEKTERSVAPEFPAADAVAAQAALRALAAGAVYVKQPARYVSTEKEITASLGKTPTTASAFVDRGNMLLDHQRFDEAIADFDKALALDPKYAVALADRGITYVWKNDEAAATRDLDAAAAIDPRQVVVYRARAMMAMHHDKMPEAIAALSTALDLQPGDPFALRMRVRAWREIGDDEHVLTDGAALIRQNPGDVESYLMRANAFRHQGLPDKAADEAAAAAAANPDDPFAHVTAARIYDALGKGDLATKEFDRAIAIKPESYIYLNRSLSRPKTDFAARRTDLDAALKLEPKSPDALAASAELLQDQGDYAGAIRTWTAMLADAPKNPELLVRRAIAYTKANQPVLAEKDYVGLDRTALRPEQLNNICWSKATANVLLQSALADCDAALARAPDSAAFLDSRAFVLLRLDRLDEALAGYDRSLAKNPSSAASLFGRAVTQAKKGDKAKADSDLQAALKRDPDVRKDFEGYGVSMPAAAAAK
ncbi:MAG: hypothetical protein JWN66_2699 [Sphingomonas bacterium]|nr:hypothetical protein [Sphingomonas bacterium]